MEKTRSSIENETITLSIKGRSMWPLLQDGQVLRVHLNQKIDLGDIACLRCKESGEIFLHRKISSKLMKGDNSTHSDQDFLVLGKVNIDYRLFIFFKPLIIKLSPYYSMTYPSVIRKLTKALIIFINALTIFSGKKKHL